MGGNQVKIRQAADLCVGIRFVRLNGDNFIKKQLMLYLGGKKSCARVCPVHHVPLLN